MPFWNKGKKFSVQHPTREQQQIEDADDPCSTDNLWAEESRVFVRSNSVSRIGEKRSRSPSLESQYPVDSKVLITEMLKQRLCADENIVNIKPVIFEEKQGPKICIEDLPHPSKLNKGCSSNTLLTRKSKLKRKTTSMDAFLEQTRENAAALGRSSNGTCGEKRLRLQNRSNLNKLLHPTFHAMSMFSQSSTEAQDDTFLQMADEAPARQNISVTSAVSASMSLNNVASSPAYTSDSDYSSRHPFIDQASMWKNTPGYHLFEEHHRQQQQQQQQQQLQQQQQQQQHQLLQQQRQQHLNYSSERLHQFHTNINNQHELPMSQHENNDTLMLSNMDKLTSQHSYRDTQHVERKDLFLYDHLRQWKQPVSQPSPWFDNCDRQNRETQSSSSRDDSLTQLASRTTSTIPQPAPTAFKLQPSLGGFSTPSHRHQQHLSHSFWSDTSDKVSSTQDKSMEDWISGSPLLTSTPVTTDSDTKFNMYRRSQEDYMTMKNNDRDQSRWSSAFGSQEKALKIDDPLLCQDRLDTVESDIERELSESCFITPKVNKPSLRRSDSMIDTPDTVMLPLADNNGQREILRSGFDLANFYKIKSVKKSPAAKDAKKITDFFKSTDVSSSLNSPPGGQASSDKAAATKTPGYTPYLSPIEEVSAERLDALNLGKKQAVEVTIMEEE